MEPTRLFDLLPRYAKLFNKPDMLAYKINNEWKTFSADEVLEATLRHEFPAADLQQDGEVLRPWLEEVVRYLEGEQPHLNLPLDIRATACLTRTRSSTSLVATAMR